MPSRLRIFEHDVRDVLRAHDLARRRASIQEGDGRTLTAAKTETTKLEATQAKPAATGPACPVCGSAMVRREAKRGTNAGSYFWGCATFPKCKGTASQ